MCKRLAFATIALAAGLALAAPAGAADDASAAGDGLAVAIFAGGCFWCVEADFDAVPGVVRTVSGFTGGEVADPSYAQVSAGGTGHREAVRIVYDPAEVSYAELLEVFWHSVDPTDAGGQFCDRGPSYATAIFALDAEQRRLAEASKRRLEDSGALAKPIVTPVLEAGPFYPAEAYHQDYADKSPVRYHLYRFLCGRNDRVRELWGEAAYAGIPEK